MENNIYDGKTIIPKTRRRCFNHNVLLNPEGTCDLCIEEYVNERKKKNYKAL